MAEVTAVVQKSSGVSTMVIILLIVVLIGGGLGAWFMLKPKKEEQTPETDLKTDNVKQPGRENVSSQNPGLSQEDIKRLFGNQDGAFNTGGNQDPKTPNAPKKPLYVYGKDAQDLIKAKSAKFQQNESVMDVIRAKYAIGRTLIQEPQHVLEKLLGMLAQVQGVDIMTNPTTSYLTFPIYGTLEPTGDKIRAKLKKLVDTPLGKINLTNARDNSQPWWIEELNINLLVGSNSASTPSADDIWWENKPHLRPMLDFYKAVNTHWVRDQWLTEMRLPSGQQTNNANDAGAQGGYNAGHLVFWVQKWIAEVDRLDKCVEWEAIRTLTAKKAEGGDEIAMTYVNPANNIESAAPANPRDQYTSNSTTVITA